MSKSTSSTLNNNKHVKELLAIMKSNRMSGAKDLHAIIGYVGAVERQIAGMENELKAMQRELENLRENNHPLRKTLQGVINALQEQVSKLREQLNRLKHTIIDGCKNALESFREKGLSALRNIAEFIDIRPGLENLRENLDNGIKQNNAAIDKIEAVSAEYHEVGRHIRNMGRTLTGKEAIQEAKPSGNLAKTFEAPFRANRACLTAARRSVNAALNAVTRLEKTEHKPPVMDTLKRFDDQIKQVHKDAPTVVRLRPVNHDER